MGLLQNLAAVAIRNKVMGNLRANCPPFPAEIQQLLADTPKLVTYLVLAARMAGKK